MRIKLPTHFANMNRAEAAYAARLIANNFTDDFPVDDVVVSAAPSRTSRNAWDVVLTTEKGVDLDCSNWPDRLGLALAAFLCGALLVLRGDRYAVGRDSLASTPMTTTKPNAVGENLAMSWKDRHAELAGHYRTAHNALRYVDTSDHSWGVVRDTLASIPAPPDAQPTLAK